VRTAVSLTRVSVSASVLAFMCVWGGERPGTPADFEPVHLALARNLARAVLAE
jgi:hypothetical protein